MRLFNGIILAVSMLLLLSISISYAALPAARSETVSGDVFLGGEYIELGISKYGSFGTDQNKPAGFFGTAARSNIGMSSDLDGFDTGTDWRMDFFMPGTQEERWSIGYKISDTPTTASNARRANTTNITDNTVTDQSSGDLLKATSVGSYGSNLQITQVVSFNKSDKFFKNTVTLENIHGSNTLTSVRYMRSFDPDNTKDKAGDYSTQNTIVNTHAAGDGKAVVKADTSWNDSDPVYVGTGGSEGGTRSPILFYSSDTRARVSYHSGLNPGTVYTASVYDSVPAKGSTEKRDGAIAIAFDVGTLAPGETATFTYYTSLDNRDFAEVEEDIAQDEEESNAAVISNVATSVDATTAQFTWNTDLTTSSQVEYGLTSNYGFTTDEVNTDTRVTSHSVSISNLKNCARYFYRVRSKTATDTLTTSPQGSFTTSGCGISQIDAGAETNIATSGGTLSYNNSGTVAKLTIPNGFSGRSASFQINKLATDSITPPSGKTVAADNVFDLIAVDTTDTKIDSFDTDVTFTIEYSSELENTYNEQTLDVYKYVDGSWVKRNCTLDMAANTLTCNLSSFSIYAVLGDTDQTSAATTTHTTSFSSTPGCTELPIVSRSYIFQVDHFQTEAQVYFMPIGGIDQFYLSYSTRPIAEEHGTVIAATDQGVQSFLVEELLPNTPYYFKVRPLKGCQSGQWSNIFYSKGSSKTHSKSAVSSANTSKAMPTTPATTEPEVSTEPTSTTLTHTDPTEAANTSDTKPSFWQKVKNIFK